MGTRALVCTKVPPHEPRGRLKFRFWLMQRGAWIVKMQARFLCQERERALLMSGLEGARQRQAAVKRLEYLLDVEKANVKDLEHVLAIYRGKCGIAGPPTAGPAGDTPMPQDRVIDFETVRRRRQGRACSDLSAG